MPVAVLALCFASPVAMAANVVGSNLIPNAGFETVDTDGVPAGWRPTLHPAGCGKAGADTDVVLAGKTSLKLALHGSGNAHLASPATPVEGGKTYLFSIGFRSEGFGRKGYEGVNAYMHLAWADAEGKSLGASASISFPYTPSDWDLRDRFLKAPAGAASARMALTFHNGSQKHSGENVPSTLWLDGVQLRQYAPPPTPEWAKRKVRLIVDGAPDTQRVQSYQLAGQRSVGGKWSKVVSDPDSTHGTAIVSPKGAGRGVMSHSAYFTGARPGLYRAVLRCKVSDHTGKEPAGDLSISSEFASARAVLRVLPSHFDSANTYQEFSVDFFLRTSGYWYFVVHTGGNQTFTADTVKVFPLAVLSDRELIEIYPGSDGTIAPALKPKRDGPLSVLLTAGLMYDYWGFVEAVRMTGLKSDTQCVWVSQGRSQTYSGFPNTAEELFRFDLVCLCNIDVTCLTLRRKRMLVEYVRRGGGLIVLGGHKSLDRGGMGGSLLDEVLPVACPKSGLPPLARFPEGASLVKADDHPVTRALDMSGDPRCFWMHDVPMREGARALVRVADKPAVVVGRFGKGRVACVLLTCMGDPPPGATPFWQWPGWAVVLRNLCQWTASRDMDANTGP